MPTPHHNDEGQHECGSLWAPYSLDTPNEWVDDLRDDAFASEPLPAARTGRRADTRADRLRDAWYRFGELLEAHGVDPADVQLLMPRWRGLRLALAREVDRERDAALAADTSVCQQVWTVCPDHGATLHLRLGQTRCRARGCRRRWSQDWLIRHCDQPAVAMVIYPATADTVDNGGPDTVRQARLCRGHLAADPDTEVVETLDERDGPAGPDTSQRAA